MLKRNLHVLIPRLALLTAFCLAIQLFRMALTLNFRYVFLPWNLLLAWLPLYFAMQLINKQSTAKSALYLFLWLLFFPNAPYIITDLLHLKPTDNFPVWYDTLLIFSFAFTGLLSGIVSSLLVFNKAQAFLAPWKARSLMLLAMFISGYGIYVGRFLRYNSWDIFSSPFQLAADTLSRLIHPFAYARTYGVTCMSGILLSLVFFIFESILLAE